MYKSEIAFLNRKLPTAKIDWQARPALSQLISPLFPDKEARNFLEQYKQILGEPAKRAHIPFIQIMNVVASKLSGGTRVTVVIPKLREAFGQEIDGASGGGGHGYNPLSTRPTRGTGI